MPKKPTSAPAQPLVPHLPAKAANAQPVPTPVTASFSPALLESRSRTHNGTFVCPTYTVLPALETACLDKLIGERLLGGQLVEAVGYAGSTVRPCKDSARILTVFVN